MEPFKQRGALDDKLGRHATTDIPENLSWEQMGPGIRATLNRKKRRRLIIWWLAAGLSAGPLLLFGPLQSEETVLSHFRIDAAGAADTATGSQAPHQATAGTDAATMTVPPAPAAPREKQRPSSPTPATPAARLTNELPEQVASLDREQVPAAVTPSTPLRPTDPLATHAPQPIAGTPPLPVAPVAGTADQQEKWHLELGAGFNRYGARGTDTTYHGQPLNGIEASLLLDRRLGESPYFLRTGLIFQQLTERTDWEEALPIQIYQPNTPDTIFRNTFTGAEEIVYTDSVAGIRRINIRQHNHLQTFTLPLLISRQWERTRWPLALQAGIDLNWSRWRAGNTIGRNAQLVPASRTGTFSTALRLEGQVYSPTIAGARLFLRLSYRRFLRELPDTRAIGHFRLETGSAVLGVQWAW
jgi:hypothetical protein